MIETVHLFAGAAIGKAWRRPWLAWPTAFASHLVLDFIPHFGEHSMFGGGHGPFRGEVIAAVVDVLIGASLLLWVTRHAPRRGLLLSSAFFASLLDLMYKPPLWGPRLSRWPPTAWLGRLAIAVDHSVPNHLWPLGVATQLAVMALSLWVLLTPWPPAEYHPTQTT